MKSREERIKELETKLDLLLKQHESFSQEIKALDQVLRSLKDDSQVQEKEAQPQNLEATLSEDSPLKTKVEKASWKTAEQFFSTSNTEKDNSAPWQSHSLPVWRRDLEKFIGENLINKIGILLTIVGVVIGAKYAIDHNLISPVMRIVLGYLTGLTLTGIALKLKSKYLNFSAVLLGGGMAILYFISYAALSFYDLYSELACFIVMLLITIGTVFAALKYNKEFIAILGLVGAYAIPYLVSQEQGSFEVLLSYVALLNLGVLFIAFKRYWKVLFSSAFIISWFIYGSWYLFDYKVLHASAALVFLILFYLTFLVAFLAYKLIRKEDFKPSDLIVLFSNSFIFYWFGYEILDSQISTTDFQGLFSICNAFFNASAALLIKRTKDHDPKLYQVFLGLAIIFLSITIAVQLSDYWMVLAWITEAAVLFWLSRSRKMDFFEAFAFPISFIAFHFAWIHWSELYGYTQANLDRIPILNTAFLFSLFFLTCGYFIVYLLEKKKVDKDAPFFDLRNVLGKLILVLCLIHTYFAIRLEVLEFIDIARLKTALINDEGRYTSTEYDQVYRPLSWLWETVWSIIFISIMQYFNLKKLKRRQAGIAIIVLTWMACILFIPIGLMNLYSLADIYINAKQAEPFITGPLPMLLRYPIFALVVGLLVMGYRSTHRDFMESYGRRSFEIFMHIMFLSLISSEFFLWLDLAGMDGKYRLTFSLLVGAYAFFLILLGIKHLKKHLRITAMVLFSVLIFKVLLYDLRELDTISKTIVLVVIGALLLLTSFWYNRQRKRMEEQNQDQISEDQES